MKKAIISGPRRAELVEVPEPRAKEDWVVVKVHAAPMCTEYKGFVAGARSEYPRARGGRRGRRGRPAGPREGRRPRRRRCRCTPAGSARSASPATTSTASSGTTSPAFTGSREGSATYAQYLLKPDWLLPAIPDGVVLRARVARLLRARAVVRRLRRDGPRRVRHRARHRARAGRARRGRERPVPRRAGHRRRVDRLPRRARARDGRRRGARPTRRRAPSRASAS